jgi:hypothetical protein
VIQLLKDLDELTVLKSYVESEALVFYKLQLFCPALSAFIDIVRQIISEIISIRDVLDSLLHNRTQAKFVQIFRPILSNLGSDIEILLFIVDEHLTLSYNVFIYPPIIYETWSSFNLFVGKIFDRLIDGKPNQQEPFSGNQYERKASKDTGGTVNDIDIEMENNPMRNRYFDADSQSVKVKGIHDRRSYFLTSSSSSEYFENLEKEEEEEEEEKCFTVYDDVCGDAVNHTSSSVDSGIHRGSDRDHVEDVEKGSTRKVRKVNHECYTFKPSYFLDLNVNFNNLPYYFHQHYFMTTLLICCASGLLQYSNTRDMTVLIHLRRFTLFMYVFFSSICKI